MTGHEQSEHDSQSISPVYLSVPRVIVLRLCGLAVVGALLAIASAAMYSGGMRRVMLAYLVAFAFVLSLSLGSLFFVLMQHLTRAGWGVLVRRPAEILGLNVITVAALFLPIALSVLGGGGELYPWALRDSGAASQHITPVVLSGADSADSAAVGSHTEQAGDDTHKTIDSLYVHQSIDDLTRSKLNWLNPGTYLFRVALFFAVWIVIARFYFVRSRHHDLAGGETDTRQMEWWSGVSVFTFAMTLTYASFDLLMSLDPHWYSTIFGVYFFAGCAVGGFSINLLAILLLERFHVLRGFLSDEHRRDLGRLLFAFVFFWGYIAFSQYMLLWYVNVPETTRWFVVRGASMAEGYTNSWGYLLILLLVCHFIIPFLGIMSRHVKSSRPAMIFWTIWMLVMHYFDLYWLVMPELGPHFTFGLPELGTLLFVSSVYLLGASIIATRTSLIPTGDPRLNASLAISDAY
jgi:hypothetical protein